MRAHYNYYPQLLFFFSHYDEKLDQQQERSKNELTLIWLQPIITMGCTWTMGKLLPPVFVVCGSKVGNFVLLT